MAEQLKGKRLLPPGQQAQLDAELKQLRLVARGRAEAQATAAPRRGRASCRRAAEVSPDRRGPVPAEAALGRRMHRDAFRRESICRPGRVVLPSIIKGPPGKKKVLESSTAHQIFGRAGRPQYDTQGFVFVLAHEDDVKIARWRQKYDQIPEDTKDPGLMKAKKALKKKMPKRRETEQYWNEAQFEKLRDAKPGNLSSRGPLPWRLLAYMLDASPDVELIRKLVAKRLTDTARIEAGQRDLDQMLLTLWRAGYVTLEPEPPKDGEQAGGTVARLARLRRGRARVPSPVFGRGVRGEGQHRAARPHLASPICGRWVRGEARGGPPSAPAV